MSKSNKITELNQRSLKLTDAELAMVDKFSVLLPMNELPEIVIANQEQSYAKPEARGGIPENAIIPFARIQSGAEENSNPSETDSEVNAKKETAPRESIPGESTPGESTPGDSIPKTPHSESHADSQTDSLNPELSVEMPKDELSISRHSDEKEVGQDSASETEDAIFDIAEHGRYHDRVESIAESIESGLSANQPTAFVLVAPVESQEQDQELIFNSLLMSIATRNPDRKLIGVQAVEPQMDSSAYSVGLGHVLSDEYLLEDVVIPSNRENLDYLAYSENSLSGTSYRNRINRMLEELKKHYDLVFVNAGIATSAETLALSGAADSFYLLIRMMDAEQDPVVQAVESLRKKGARLAGCILSGYQREAS